MSTVKPAPSRPAHHANNNGTRFINPWPSAGAPTWAELLQASFPFGFYKADLDTHHKARSVKVIKPDWGAASLKDRNLERRTCIIGTWLGHAGALVEIPSLHEADSGSLWLLFDPIFSTRAGPTQYNGVVRAKSSPCQVENLPGGDALFVPLGIKQWLSSSGIPDKQIYELDWWQNREYSPLDFGLQVTSTVEEETILRFSCVPAQHNSGRIVIDQGSTLWCGWVVERLLRSKDESAESKVTRQGAVYHAGDTGYRRITRSETVCPAFKEIGERFGPFDMSFVPIWRGGSLGFISNLGLRLSHDDIPSALHGSPTDAVAIHKDVRSRNTIGIHFGTFVGSENETHEAVIEFGQACDEHGVGDLDDENESDKGRAGTLDIGGSLAVAIE